MREHPLSLDKFCAEFGVDVSFLIERILSNAITINFHPDRYANNGKIILDNLIEQGMYHGQFRTGTTNGARSAQIGGNRYAWEQRIFFEAYPPEELDRPKYGALNLFKYIDGAAARFGSCFFALKPDVVNRCTFSYGDSYGNPTVLCTSDTFAVILAAMLQEYQDKGTMLDKVFTAFSPEEVLAVLLNPNGQLRDLGRNLDLYIETHVHGDIRIAADVEAFYVDASFENTQIGEKAKMLCEKYGVSLKWIPKRQLAVDTIDAFFRGDTMRPLAAKIDAMFDQSGFVNAEIIGRASRDSVLHPQAWAEMGSEPELFQLFKRLWHTVCYFG
jgi:hypothetical protein